MNVFGVYCYHCENFVFSRARHDFNACNCWSKNKEFGVSIDGGQSDYFKLSSGKKSFIKFLNIDIEQTEEMLVSDWATQENKFGIIKIPRDKINGHIIDNIGAIRRHDLIDGMDYLGICRNAKTAKWSEKEGCFFYIRKKFDSIFLERINHPEDDDGFDLFIPFAKVGDIRSILEDRFKNLGSQDFPKYEDKAKNNDGESNEKI